MPTVIKADAGHDFLALVPHLAGYHPRDSILLVAFRGKRTCGALRFDLPHGGALPELRRLATTMVATMCRIPSVDAVVPIVYTDDSFAGGQAPHQEFADIVCHRAEVSGLLVRDCLCEAADGWSSYLDPDTPDGGHPLSLIAGSPVNTVTELDGHPPRDAVVGETALPTVDLATKERVARLLAGLQPMCIETRMVPATADAAIRDGSGSLSDDVAASLLGAIRAPAVRDVVLATWAFSREVGAAVVRDTEEWSASGELPEGFINFLFGEGPRPNPDRVEAAITLLMDLAARAPRSARPPALAMIAWLTWALGRSSRAAAFVRAALEIDPDYGLAELIGAMLAGGRLPDWAFDVPEVDEASVRYAETEPRPASMVSDR